MKNGRGAIARLKRLFERMDDGRNPVDEEIQQQQAAEEYRPDKQRRHRKTFGEKRRHRKAVVALIVSLFFLWGVANNLNDITTLQSQITGVRSQIDQLQGQNNLLRNEASYSDLAVTATEAWRGAAQAGDAPVG